MPTQSAKTIIKFDPESELRFHGPYLKPITALLRMRPLETSDGRQQQQQIWAFKIKTTAPKFYSVSPTHGYIQSTSSNNDKETIIHLTFNGNEFDLRNGKIKHKFLIQLIRGPNVDMINTVQPDQYWKDFLSSLSQKNDSIIYEHKLQCIFDPIDDDNDNNNDQQQFVDQAQSTSNSTQQSIKPHKDEFIDRLLAATPSDTNNNNNTTSITTSSAEIQQERKFSMKTLFFAIIGALIAILAALPIYFRSSCSISAENNSNESSNTNQSNDSSSTNCSTTSHRLKYMAIAMIIAAASFVIYQWRKSHHQQQQHA